MASRGLYVKLDVSFFENHKIVAAGREAGWLYLQMLCLSKRTLSDGFVSDLQVRQMAGRNGDRWCQKLADCALITRRSDADRTPIGRVPASERRRSDTDQTTTGWQIAGWSDTNRSAEEVERIRQERRSAGRKGGLARAEAEAKAKQIASDAASKVPNPETETETETETSTTALACPEPTAPEPAEEAEVRVDLYAELLELAGVASGPEPTAGERATAAKLLAKGYDVEHLRARAARASLADVSPRALLLKLLTEDINQDSEPAVSPALGGPIPMLGHRAPERDDDWGTQWNYLAGGGGRSHLANDTAKQAWHESRLVRKRGTVNEAKFAFRDAYLAITRSVPA